MSEDDPVPRYVPVTVGPKGKRHAAPVEGTILYTVPVTKYGAEYTACGRTWTVKVNEELSTVDCARCRHTLVMTGALKPTPSPQFQDAYHAWRAHILLLSSEANDRNRVTMHEYVATVDSLAVDYPDSPELVALFAERWQANTEHRP